MELKLPEFSLVLLVGIAGSGKSTFARKHFRATEILSSDTLRAMIADDERDQDATADAFEALHLLVQKRLAHRRLTVVDATNVLPKSRQALRAIARDYHCEPVVIVLDVGTAVATTQNHQRTDRQVEEAVILDQQNSLRRFVGKLDEEGFRRVFVLNSPEALARCVVVRERLSVDRREDSGPFDIIGDIHGCYDELRELLTRLGYAVDDAKLGSGESAVTPPAGRRVFFVGDLVDRGPASPKVLRLAMNMVKHGQALCVPGNHEWKFYRWLRGKTATLTHGLALTVEQMEKEPFEFRAEVADFIDTLESHYVLDGGSLVVAHAGLTEDLQGRTSGKVLSFALYGQTTGEKDEYGLPVRQPWALEYRGKATVVYGHTPTLEAEWINNTICLDTGCVFGGKLTALRYPEREIVSIPAKRVYFEPVRPLA